jgi:hypothetical protein
MITKPQIFCVIAIGGFNMKRFLENFIDAIPTPSPKTGDKMVNLMLAFVAGFIVALLIYGG